MKDRESSRSLLGEPVSVDLVLSNSDLTGLWATAFLCLIFTDRWNQKPGFFERALSVP
jgi:hypothetical protein